MRPITTTKKSHSLKPDLYDPKKNPEVDPGEISQNPEVESWEEEELAPHPGPEIVPDHFPEQEPPSREPEISPPDANLIRMR